ncbi:TonB-dependent receptor domain-containing protein [Caulobacter mirabilis]|uniref:TonB-dependent receptor n=1 Tax=Caulobacter mirabilis TaxID=69666 RepID=A0A2D2ATD8_9CAUL|nr:TonB-dependent receptor [Caulobacter mirabilis]ATQ41237.1 TonB-dependent receptor [Caulobacter mirabilis]
MNTRKFAFVATTALVGSMMLAGAAYAQSTGTAEVEEVVVTAAGQKKIEGVIAETAPKARTTINQEYIDRQGSGQTILQTLNLTPGLNFVNNDPYGASGGNIRLRGFDGNRISLTFDGIPLNDTGNYAIYSNQQLDSELISQANVITGATDVDTPTISATGGVINYTVRKPRDEFGGMATFSAGTFNFKRVFGLVETGEFGPWGTKAWFSASYQNYDKFKGRGDLERKQFNARIWQDIGDNGDFVSLALHWNENRNYAYYSPNLGNSNYDPTKPISATNTPRQIDQFGWDVDFDGNWVAPTAQRGVADGDTNPNSGATSNTGWWGGRINPSNTGNVRIQSRYSLTDNLRFTFDPSFQYVMANGGSQMQVINEFDPKLIGKATTFPTCGGGGTGVDLNNDGDCLDRVRYFSPSNTNTRRYGLNTSLIWDINDDSTLRLAYTYDKGRHRQTSEGGFVNQQTGQFEDWFGGKETWGGRRLTTADGALLRFRDRFSIAELSQLALEYRGRFFDDQLRVVAGLQYKEFSRELNQYCYTQNNSSTVNCTTQTATPIVGGLGNVTLPGSATSYIPPFSYTAKINDVLPNVSASWQFDGASSMYASYSEQISALRTDSYYYVYRATDGSIQSLNAKPESSKTVEVGYRYQASTVLAQANVFYTNYENRVVSSYDPDQDTYIERNVGSVKTKGVEGSVGWRPTERLSLLGSVTYTAAEYQDNLLMRRIVSGPTTTLVYAPIKGKQLVETPEWMATGRIAYDFGPVQAGLQAKYVGERFATDMNDMKIDSYTLFDLDVRMSLEKLANVENAFLQLNVWNLTDERYLGNLGTQVTANSNDKTAWNVTSQPFASVGAPRTFMLTLRLGF